MTVTEITLAGLALPEGAPLRESGVPQVLRDAWYHRIFDARTLIYDCAYSAARGEYLFTCPAFENLWPVFRDGLRIDGAPVCGLRRKRVGRCEIVRVTAARGTVSLSVGAGTVPIPVRASDAEALAGRNVLAAISRNNPLDWIVEWARFHARTHGADAVVLFDNGSTDYTPAEIGAALGAVEELARVVVVSAPFIYGAKLIHGAETYRLQYLQTAMINLARTDIASRARAVLSCDIDEMVLPRGQGTIFDAACAAVAGGVQIPGAWVFPDRAEPLPCPQHRHGFRADPDRTCQPKWCARPDGPLSRSGGWNVHSFGAGLRKLVSVTRDFSLAHCSGTTTAWKSRSKRFDFPENIVPDPVLAAALAAALPEA